MNWSPVNIIIWLIVAIVAVWLIVKVFVPLLQGGDDADALAFAVSYLQGG